MTDPGNGAEGTSRWRWRMGAPLVASGVIVGVVGLFLATEVGGTCKNVRLIAGGGFECEPPSSSALGPAVVVAVLGVALFVTGVVLTWRRPPQS